MKEKEAIFSFLRAVAARMRAARLLSAIGFVTCVVLFALAVFELLRAPLGDLIGDTHRMVLIGGLVAFSVFVLAGSLMQVNLARAAGLADTRLRLDDEIKSAYWFACRTDGSDKASAGFIDAHLVHAARKVQPLKGSNVLPVNLPGNLLFAPVLAVLLAGATWSSPSLVQSVEDDTDGRQTIAEPLTARAFLAATASDDEEIKALDQALATFEQSDISPREMQQALSAAREAVDHVNMRAFVAHEAAATLALAMRNRPELEQVAETLEQGRTDEAIEMLGQLRKDPREGGIEDDQAAQQSAEPTRAEMPLDQAVGQTVKDLSGMTGLINDDALNSLIDNLDEIEASMELQRRVNETERRAGGMRDVMQVDTQRSSLTAARFGAGQRPSGAPSPQSGNSDMSGGTMFRQGTLSRNKEEDEADDGSTTGASSGHSAALALHGRETRRLDAQLKLETVSIDSRAEVESENDDDSWLYSASPQQVSESEYDDVRSRESYNRAGLVQNSRVSMQHRRAVRDYFLNLHEVNAD
jgi:hypothetical protein